MKALRITSSEILGTDGKTHARPRGNRKTRIPEILGVSIEVLAREGYAAFSTRRVATEAGIHLSTLQHYFPTREELLRSTVQQVIGTYLERFRPVTDSAHLPPEARFDALMDFFFAEFSKPEVAAFWTEVWAMGRHETFARDAEADGYRRSKQHFADLIAEINPDLTPHECAVRGAMINLQMEGVISLVRRFSKNAPDQEALLVAAKAVCKALTKNPE
jgi:AcrR family transcriptional regulator